MPTKKTTEPTKSTPKVFKGNNEKQLQFERDVLKDPSVSPIFDVVYYREVFMSIRKGLDDLYEKREKSNKDSEAYDEAVYNLTTMAVTDAGAQDFLSYCYKKGKYDFCLMNYDKYMKWSILAAANGNAFTLSKLQIFFTNAIEEVLALDNHEYLLDFLELSPENYYTFINKLICEEMAKNLQISAEILIKSPEVYQEETEELTRVFDKSKIEAAKSTKENLKSFIDQLGQYLEEQYAKEKKEKENAKLAMEKANEPVIEEQKVEESSQEEKPKLMKKTKIKKFRY